MLDPSKWTPEQHTKIFLMITGILDAKNHFRTFADGKTKSDPSLSRNLTGLYSENALELQKLNDRGAGVFAVINKGGHKDADITEVTAVFADTDGAPLEPILEALTPHCVVNTSPGKFHVYWRVNDFPLALFKNTQTQIAKRFDCDASVNNLSRVMRIPGFKHQKSTLFDVRIVQIDAELPPYSPAEIVDAFMIAPNTPSPAIQSEERPIDSTLIHSLRSNTYSLTDVEVMLSFIGPSEYHTWRNVIFALVYEYGESARELAKRWSRGDLWNSGDRS